jgi:CubicO group peptidase (beta-lactamase class C family)
MKKLFISFFIFLFILGGLFYFLAYPKLPILSGYAARMACTCHFIQDRAVSSIKEQELGFSFFKYVDIDIDEEDDSATASVFGLSPRRAVLKGKKGCVLIQGDDDYHNAYNRPSIIDTFEWNFSNALTQDQKHQIDTFLYDQGSTYVKKTRSCLIVHRDSIIYESYADGFNKDIPQLGWSMTKSVTGALIGEMIEDNLLDTNQTNLFNLWKDERSKISLSDLLHMKSGLSWHEDYTDVSPATNMLFKSENVINKVLQVGMEANPGTHFEYSSGSSNLLFGLIREKLQDDEAYFHYPYDRLFAPLGMSSAFIETDETGNYIGSSYMWATPRDWAKFGLLYLHHGQWNDSQVIDSSWVNYTFESDVVSKGEYGTQFWHNDANSLKDSPKNMIYADGFQGQRVFIFPDQDLIIVRMGLNNIDFNQLNAMVTFMIK